LHCDCILEITDEPNFVFGFVPECGELQFSHIFGFSRKQTFVKLSKLSVWWLLFRHTAAPEAYHQMQQNHCLTRCSGSAAGVAYKPAESLFNGLITLSS